MKRSQFLLTLIAPLVLSTCKALGISPPMWARPKLPIDPVMLSLVRRAMPNLIAADICGVQPIAAPSGLIFDLLPKHHRGGSMFEATRFAKNDVTLFS